MKRARAQQVLDRGVPEERREQDRHRRQVGDAGQEALAADRRRREGWLADAVQRDLTPREREVLAEATALLARIAEGRDPPVRG